MAKKPENQFITSVHKYIPRRKLYQMKNHNAYVGGIPDVWYSGSKHDLWIEYKFIPVATPRTRIVPDLSNQQLLWIKGRLHEGRNVLVVVGSKNGGTIYRTLDEMLQGLPALEYLDRLQSREELANMILNFCNGENNV